MIFTARFANGLTVVRLVTKITIVSGYLLYFAPVAAATFSQLLVLVMDFLATLGQMGVLFVVVIIGFVCSKLNIMNDAFNRSLSVLIINVTAPCIILSSVMGDTLPERSEIVPVFLLGTATLFMLLIFGYIGAKLLRTGDMEGIYRFMFAFGYI